MNPPPEEYLDWFELLKKLHFPVVATVSVVAVVSPPRFCPQAVARPVTKMRPAIVGIR